MKKQAALLLAAVMSVGTVLTAPAAETFADINDVPWAGAQAYINNVYQNGIMVGDINEDGERVFRANEEISYNETVQIIYTLSGETVSDETINKWADIMKSNSIPRWAYDCVSYALENGIITRTDIAAFMNLDGTARSTTREDAAYIFGRFLAMKGFEEKAGTADFADKTKISVVCQQYVSLLASYDIIVGDDDNNFNPNNTINRAEMAVIATKTYTLLKDIESTPIESGKTEADYSGYINNVTDTSIMLYTFDGKSVILDRASDSQYYLDGEEISTRGIYSLTTNGILVQADIYVNSNNIAMEIYCTRADVAGEVTGLGLKSGTYKKGSRSIPYAFYTVTITYANGLSRSYRIDEDTDFYYDDEEIDIEEFQELLWKSLPEVDDENEVIQECIDNKTFTELDRWEDDDEDDDDGDRYLPVYAEAEVEVNDEYYVYPQVLIKKLYLSTVQLETAVISSINNESIIVLDDDGYEYEYKLADNARFYVDGDKVRITAFKKAVTLNLSTVEIDYDTDGYVTRLDAETN